MLADATMTVREARAVLQDTSRRSREQVEAAEKVVAAFYQQHPRHQSCVACGSMRWAEHTGRSGDAIWACVGCHRSASLTREEWEAQLAPTRAKDAKKSAAIRQLAATELEPSIAAAIEARTTYINALAALGWLVRQGHGDARAARLLQEADVPPSRWQEAATLSASGGVLAGRIAALESGE